MQRILCLLAVVLALQPMAAQEPAIDTAAAEQLGWQLAVHSYTYQKFSIFDAIAKSASVGVTCMSVSGGVNMQKDKRVTATALTGADLTAIKDCMVKAGISPVFVNMGVVTLPADEARCRPVFTFAKQQGIKVLVAEPEEKALDVIEKLCQEFDIRVAIHNHPKPSHYWDPDTVLAALQGRSAHLGACADVGHWVRSGLEPVACLKKLEGRIITLHFKDLSADAHEDVPWGTGISRPREMMLELKRQGFRGAFCIEYENHWETSTPEIAQCVRFFHATCAGMAKTP